MLLSTPLPQPQQPVATTDLSAVTIALPFPERHRVEIIHYVDFSDWILSLSNMHLRFFHVFLWLESSFLCSAKFEYNLRSVRGSCLKCCEIYMGFSLLSMVKGAKKPSCFLIGSHCHECLPQTHYCQGLGSSSRVCIVDRDEGCLPAS